MRASSLEILGRKPDPRYGLWRQGVAPTLIHDKVDRYELWPRRSDWAQLPQAGRSE